MNHMDADICLRAASNGTPERDMVEALWQLYQHDLSEYRGRMPDASGRFDLGRLPTFFADDPDRCAYVFLLNRQPVGFGMIRGLAGARAVVAEFFLVRAIRRQGVGGQAALQLLRSSPSPYWGIPFQEQNVAAARFWRKVATAAVGERWREEVRIVKGSAHSDPDTWLLLDLAGPQTLPAPMIMDL
jgi:predicted acetyltransferase